MNKHNLIIDGHSHIGNDYFHGNTDVNKYIELMNKTNIDYGLLMPTPSPVKLTNMDKAKYLGWYLNKNDIIYYSEVYPQNIDNPYKVPNYELYETIIKTGQNNLFFVPLIHPMLDTPEYLETLIKEIDPVAFKIHGIGAGIDPRNIPERFTEFIKKSNIPLIIHTDYDNGVNITRYDTYLLRNLNTALQWLKYLNANNIKAVLNHGCSLDKLAFEEINKSDMIKVGIGPDMIIEHDIDRLKTNRKEGIEYLRILQKLLKLNKLVFDIDYNWNINPKTSQLDTSYVERIENIWPEKSDQAQIFSGNILEHFDILKRKVRERRK